jgi:hypothetical protein
MLMVIFGAGASYDSWPSFPPDRLPRDADALRPPLAKELFLYAPQFRAVSAKYSRCQPLIPYLESQENVENILEQFRIDAVKSAERRSQLTAIQFYIREIVGLCEAHWRQRTNGVTTYRTFLDQLAAFPDVCFVTFNYDTLLEDALEKIDVRFHNIDAYASVANYKVFKLHGSTDWKRWIRKVSTTMRANGQPTEEELIRGAPEVGDDAVITKVSEGLPAAEREIYYQLPALAIPTLSKSSFVCPSEHVSALRECVSRVDKIAIVGWRAGEAQFLKMLAEGLKPGVPVVAACGTGPAETDTINNLKNAGVPVGSAEQSLSGFTAFVLKHGIDWLRKQPPS